MADIGRTKPIDKPAEERIFSRPFQKSPRRDCPKDGQQVEQRNIAERRGAKRKKDEMTVIVCSVFVIIFLMVWLWP